MQKHAHLASEQGDGIEQAFSEPTSWGLTRNGQALLAVVRCSVTNLGVNLKFHTLHAKNEGDSKFSTEPAGWVL